jgi:hypothetical protein
MKQYILNSVENYKNELNDNETMLFLKFVGMVHEMIILCNDSITSENKDYVKHILITCIKNSTYIYNFILLYTKNLELALYHTQRSILYYFEFIIQVGEGSQNTLKLTTKDATLFIYKKTVFDINDEYKQTYQETAQTKLVMKHLELYMNIYNKILIHLISSFDLNKNNMTNLQKTILTKMYKIVEALINLPAIYNGPQSSSIVSNKLTELLVTIDNLNHSYHHYEFINKNYLGLIEYCIKKIYKIDNNNIKNNLLLSNIDIQSTLLGYSVCKIFNYLTTHHGGIK